MNAEALLEVLRRVLKFSPLANIGVRDILFDPSSLTISCVGDALRLELRALQKTLINHDMNYEWAHLFGIPIEKRQYGTRPMWFQEPDVYIADFVEALGSAVLDGYAALAGEKWDAEDVNVTLTPDPGYPWNPKTVELYSARKNKWFKVKPPPYMIQIRDRDGATRPAADYCLLAPRIDTAPLKGEIGWIDGVEYVVTHSTTLGRGYVKAADERYGAIRSCDGLLFASLATGTIPATNFGEVVLVASASIPLLGMSPYRKKGAWLVVTYPSDVWTVTTGEMIADVAIEAFNQLHGDSNLYYTNHFYVLGPNIRDEGFGGTPVAPIASTKKLALAIKRRSRIWTREMSYEKFIQASNVDTPERYGYLETKANAIVDWKLIPLAICPAASRAVTAAGLAKMGFAGDLVTIDVGQPMLSALLGESGKFKKDEMSYLQYQYAWLVLDAIKTYGSMIRVEAR